MPNLILPSSGYIVGRAVKTAIETINNSITLQDDDHIHSLPYSAGKRYALEMVLYYTGLDTAALKFSLAFSGGATMQHRLALLYKQTSTATLLLIGNAATSTPLTIASIYSSAATEVLIAKLSLYDPTAGGTIKLQWAQNTAIVTDTSLLVGSYAILTELS